MGTLHAMKRRLAEGLIWLFLILLGLCMLVPFVWMLLTSFKLDNEVFAYPIRWLPSVWRWSNYVEVWTRIPYLAFFMNTLKLAVIVTAGQLLTCSLAAYSFSKLDYPGRDRLFLLYLATMMIPWHSIMIPQFVIVKGMGLVNSHLGLILLQAFSPFGVFLLRQYLLGIPLELNQAARIDGCGELRIYWQIVMPLAKPGLAALTIFTFTFVWNDYMGPLIYLNTSALQTIQIGLRYFQTEHSMEYAVTMAGTAVSLIPMILIYLFAQKHVIQGIAFAGLKG